MPTDTVKRLAEITDAAAFERLATSVLRAADPTYRNLAHPGVNTDGKTVKSPLDNIGWVQFAGGSRLVGAAHTTCYQTDLEGKWLHDTATVKPRKVGAKPTQPAGDLVKAISEAEVYRAKHAGLAVTLALMTNRETPVDVRVRAETLAATAKIDLDVWSVSRIADFLDTTERGQVIRRVHLGTPVELVSMPLLQEMGIQSIADHLCLPEAREFVVRSGFNIGAGHALVVGDSGMGKTTACVAILRHHIEAGAPGIVIKNEYITASTTMAEALELELRRQNSGLEGGAGIKALSLSTEEAPFLVLLEDINRSDNPGGILEKVIGWVLVEASKQQKSRSGAWRLVCPVWPRYLEILEKRRDVFPVFNMVHLGRFTDEEGRRAVVKRAETIGRVMDEHRAAAIAKSLGNDPLLIGLHDLTGEANASLVLERYVAEKLAQVANRIERFPAEVEAAISAFVLEMLSRRKLNPSWLEAMQWFTEIEMVSILRAVVLDGSVLRLSGAGDRRTVDARHDRVMNFLMAHALADKLDSNAVNTDYLRDPFFAESVGTAALRAEIPADLLYALMENSPAAAFFALKAAVEGDHTYQSTAVAAIETWLAKPETALADFANQRFAAMLILAETDSPHVLRLTDMFPESDRHWDSFLAARFRNGDVLAGLSMLTMFEFGMTVAGRRSLLAHVQTRYGNNLVKSVESLLVQANLSPRQRAGALYLAGYIGSAVSSATIRTAWDLDGSERDLRAHLWAASRCCGSEAAETLGPVCDAWEALPEEKEAPIGQPADRLASDGVSWEFAEYTPHEAVPYFVQRANQSEKLNWPITYMLRAVDSPDALEHIARWLAERDRKSSGYPFGFTLTSDWERHFRERGRVMSQTTKQRLLEMAMDTSANDYVRKRAFDLWELTFSEGDVDIARSVDPSSVLYSRALWARARRKDISVTSELAKKIEEHPPYWLQAGRYIWSEDMTAALARIIERAGNESSGENAEHAAAEALEYLDAAVAENILVPLWGGLKTKAVFVQSALLIGTTKLQSLVQQAVAQSAQPTDLFKYFSIRVTLKQQHRDGLSRLKQMEAFIPYLQLLTPSDISHLWRLCTDRGWLDFRTRHLDSLMQQQPERHAYLPGDAIKTQDLDRALGGVLIAEHRWVEMQVERGAPRTAVFQALLAWLEQRLEVDALKLVSGIFSEAANREEFELLRHVAGRRPDVEAVLAATRFNVFRRSLV